VIGGAAFYFLSIRKKKMYNRSDPMDRNRRYARAGSVLEVSHRLDEGLNILLHVVRGMRVDEVSDGWSVGLSH
jgi:hypothetical protein